MPLLLRHNSGREYVFVQDEVADKSSFDNAIRIHDASATISGLWVPPEQLQEARGSYPNRLSYGIWQTIYESGIWRGGDYDSVIYYSNRDAEEGGVVSIKDGRWIVTAEILGGLPAGIAAHQPLYVTSEDLASLPLPKTCLKLHAEIYRERRAAIQRGATLAAVYLGIAGVLGYALDSYLVSASNRSVERAGQIQMQVQGMRMGINDERARKSPMTPEVEALQRIVLSRLMELEAVSGPLTVRELRPNLDPMVTAVLSDEPSTLTFDVELRSAPYEDLAAVFPVDGSDRPDWDPSLLNASDINNYFLRTSEGP